LESPKHEDKRKPVLEARRITKKFSGIVALFQVDLRLYPNEILALLGDNGAGKSTLIKCLSGAHSPSEGEIFVRGERIIISNPKKAKSLGVETIYQDMALFDILNVPSNLFAGKPLIRSWGFLDDKSMKRESVRILNRLDIRVRSLNQVVRNLSGGQRHAVSIGRAVYVGNTPQIVLMDEPTAGLGVEESNKLLQTILDLKEEGISVILISHNLDHVFAVADRAVVLRGGKLVGEKDIKKTNRTEIVQMMLGVV